MWAEMYRYAGTGIIRSARGRSFGRYAWTTVMVLAITQNTGEII